MEDEEIGFHLPEGKYVPSGSFKTIGMKSRQAITHGDYQKWKDSLRKPNIRFFIGKYYTNKRAYEAGEKTLYVRSNFVEEIKRAGWDISGMSGQITCMDETQLGLP
jgi:hypothetical protein